MKDLGNKSKLVLLKVAFKRKKSQKSCRWCTRKSRKQNPSINRDDWRNKTLASNEWREINANRRRQHTVEKALGRGMKITSAYEKHVLTQILRFCLSVWGLSVILNTSNSLLSWHFPVFLLIKLHYRINLIQTIPFT